MDCKKFEARISDYLDNAMPKAEAREFAGHLLQCRACRALTDEIKAALQDVKEELEAPAELENSLFSIAEAYAPLSCFQFEELITEFLDGFVPASIYHKFEAHTEECHACSNLLTEVVLAVAACHSAHSEEEFEVSQELNDRLIAVMPQAVKPLSKRWAAKVSSFATSILPRNTQSRRWNFATASGLAFAMFVFLLIGVSDDGSIPGIYRQVRNRVVTFYSQSTGIYDQKDELIASFERMRSNIGEVWNTLGGVTEADAARGDDANALKRRSSSTSSKF